MANRDYGYDNAVGLGASEVSVSPGTDKLVSALNAYSGTSRTLMLDPGIFTEDWTKLNAVIANLRIIGAAPSADGSHGSVITFSNAATPANTVVFSDTDWRYLVFNGASLGNGKRPFTGSSLVRNTFAYNTIYDFVPDFIVGHGSDLNLLYNRFLASGAVTVQSGVLDPQGPRVNMVGNSWELGSSLAAGHAPIGSDGTGSATYDDWTIRDNSFNLASPKPYDAFIDLEFGAGTGGRFYIVNNRVNEAKLAYAVNCGYVLLKDNYQHITSAYTAVTGGNNALLSDAGTSGTKSNGTFDVLDNLVVQDAAATSCQDVVIQLTNLAYNASINIKRNRFFINGTNNGGGGGHIHLGTNSAPSAVAYDLVDVSDNVFGFTVLPVTPISAVSIGANGTATYSRVVVNHNRVLGTTAGNSTTPPTVNGSALTYFVTYGLAGKTNTFSDISMDGNDTSAVTLTGPTGVVPAIFATAGSSPVYTRFYYGDRNIGNNSPYGGISNNLLAQSSTVGTGNLLTYTPPADGYFEVCGGVNIVTLGSASLKFNSSWTDENGSAASAIHFVAAPGTGTAVSAGAMATAANWHPMSQRIFAKAGNPINAFLSGTTATSYDVFAFIRQVA